MCLWNEVLLIQVATWINPGNTILCGRSQAQKTTYSVISLIRNVVNRQIWRRLGARRRLVAKAYGIGLRDDENILEFSVGWLYNSVTMLKATELDILNG